MILVGRARPGCPLSIISGDPATKVDLDRNDPVAAVVTEAFFVLRPGLKRTDLDELCDLRHMV